jgi:DNA-binding CsgD family transcriptional regulator
MLAERDAALRQLHSLFAEAADGKGQIVLVSAAGAIGKTALLDTFAGQVAGADGLVLTAACSRAEQMDQFGVAGQLIRSTKLPNDVTRRVEHVLGVISTLIGAQPSKPAKKIYARTIRQLCEIIFALANHRPVALIIDDAEFLDDGTKQTLLYLQRRILSARVMIALTESVHTTSPDRPFVADLTRQPYFTTIRLSTLTNSGLRDLVRESCPGIGDADIAEFQRLSGGNPLLVKALIEDNRPAGDVTAAEHPPTRPEDHRVIAGDAFRAAILTCLHRWDPALLACARGIALLGEHASAATLQRLLDDPAISGTSARITASAVNKALAALNLSGLVADNRFLHPTATQAVISDIPPEILPAIHARVAIQLHEEGTSASDIASHLIAADQVPGEWAVVVLQRAAKQALAGSDIARAAQCLKLARAACNDARTRAVITSRLANVQWNTNPSAAAHYLETLKTAVRDGHLGKRDMLTLMRHLLWHGQTDSAADVLSCLDEWPSEPRSPFELELRGLLRWLRYNYPTLHERVQTRLTTRAQSSAEPAGGARLSAALLGAFTTADRDKSTGWAEHLLQACHLQETALESVTAALLTLIRADHQDRAAQWCESIRAEAMASNAATWAAALADIRAEIAWRQGDLPNTERFARLALTTLSPHNWGVAVGSPLSHLVLAATAMGDAELAGRALRLAVPEEMQATWFWPMYLRARGSYYLRCADRSLAALNDFETCGRLMTEWGMDSPLNMPWRCDAAQVLVRMGELGKAKDLIRTQLNGPAGTNPRVRGPALRVLAFTCDAPRRLSMLREAVELLQECGDRFELALALAGLSNAHSALGEFSRARLIARRAMQTAKSCHAEVRCQQLLPRAAIVTSSEERRGGEETDSAAVLSEAERRVASLAAAGHTNREISRKLFITVSTVEQHLTRVYRKLNVNRRSQLPDDLPLAAAESA